jgi:hypothetical protein
MRRDKLLDLGRGELLTAARYWESRFFIHGVFDVFGQTGGTVSMTTGGRVKLCVLLVADLTDLFRSITMVYRLRQ